MNTWLLVCQMRLVWLSVCQVMILYSVVGSLSDEKMILVWLSVCHMVRICEDDSVVVSLSDVKM